MNDLNKTKQELIAEINLLKEQIKNFKIKELDGKNIEFALQQSEQRYKNIFENSPLGIICVDKSGKILTVNNSLLQILGSPSAKDTLAINVLTYVPMIEARISAAVIECMESGKNMVTEHPYRTKWRKNVFLRLHLAPMRNANGEIIGCEGIVDDISELKTNEEILRLNEECSRAIADYTYNWESWIGTDGSVLWVNPAVERITGYTVDECLNMDQYPLSFVYEEDKKILEPVIKQNWGSSAATNFIFRIQHKNKSVIWISASWQQIFDSNSSPLGTRISFNDITDRMMIEKTLEEKQTIFRQILEKSQDAFILLKNNVIMDCSDSACQYLKAEQKDQLLNKPVSSIFPANQPDGINSVDQFNKMISAAKKEDSHRFDWTFLTKDNRNLSAKASLLSIKIKVANYLALLWKPE